MKTQEELQESQIRRAIINSCLREMAKHITKIKNEAAEVSSKMYRYGRNGVVEGGALGEVREFADRLLGEIEQKKVA